MLQQGQVFELRPAAQMGRGSGPIGTESGGASRSACSARALFRTRTGDPLLTMEVLYQLS